jgi:hypothetical protein
MSIRPIALSTLPRPTANAGLGASLAFRGRSAPKPSPSFSPGTLPSADGCVLSPPFALVARTLPPQALAKQASGPARLCVCVCACVCVCGCGCVCVCVCVCVCGCGRVCVCCGCGCGCVWVCVGGRDSAGVPGTHEAQPVLLRARPEPVRSTYEKPKIVAGAAGNIRSRFENIKQEKEKVSANAFRGKRQRGNAACPPWSAAAPRHTIGGGRTGGQSQG